MDSISAGGGVTVRQRVMEGSPTRVLLDAADGADLLVVGRRGHGGFAGMLLGSVSQYCVRHSPCPVVIIRGSGTASGVAGGRRQAATGAIPYLMSACAQLTYLVSRRRRVEGWLLARDLGIAGAAALFSMWVTFAAGWAAVYQAMVLVLAGVVIYAFVVAWRERTGQIPEPVDVAPADEGAAAVTAPAVTEPHRRHLRILGNGGRHTDHNRTEAGS